MKDDLTFCVSNIFPYGGAPAFGGTLEGRRMEAYKMDLISVSHGCGEVNFHVVFSPKYRYNVLTGEVKSACEQIFREVARAYNFVIKELQVMGDHLHLFVCLRPDHCVSRIVQVLKSISARKLFRLFPHLRRRYWSGHLWSRGKFYRSVGAVNNDTVRHYIRQSQGVKHKIHRNKQTKITDYSKQ